MATENPLSDPTTDNTLPTPKPETIKINREVLWKIHESIQHQLKPIKDFYEKNSELIEVLDEKRQEIIRRYYQFENGELKVNKQQQYVPIKGVNIQHYDQEMEALMSGFEDIQPSLLDLNIKRPQPEMKVVN